MGGGQSLAIGLTHLEQFAWVGRMSASVAKREFVLVKGSEMTNGIFSAFSQAARTASATVRQCPISNRFAIHSPTSLFGPS
jgi:enterochelin esterase-like enzyme